jgi:hypothetical protein
MSNYKPLQSIQIILHTILILTAQTAYSMNIEAFGTYSQNMMLTGDIAIGDDIKLSKILETTPDHIRLVVSLGSNGGDVMTAMKVGRVLRKYHADVVTSKCFSSCVLAFVGGVTRSVGKSARAKGIGIHRAYYSSLPSSMSESDIADKRSKLKLLIAQYLEEMNVTVNLLNLMEAIPPEQLKILSEKELIDLGLNAPDPIWDEKNVAAEASIREVTSLEYRRRRATAERRCANVGVERSDACEGAMLLDISETDYLSRDARYLQWRAAFTPDRKRYQMNTSERRQNDYCWTIFMVQNKLRCN